MEGRPKRIRQRLEEELYHSLESARIKYEQAKREASSSHATALDTLGTADGGLALRNAYAQQVALQGARLRYLSALKAFSDLIVHGILPGSDDSD